MSFGPRTESTAVIGLVRETDNDEGKGRSLADETSGPLDTDLAIPRVRLDRRPRTPRPRDHARARLTVEGSSARLD